MENVKNGTIEVGDRIDIAADTGALSSDGSGTNDPNCFL